ncbi:hypothetical protein Tco_0755988 [Tanacetum coccineum]
MVDVPIPEENPVVQVTLLVDTVISIILEKTTPSPKQQPPRSKTKIIIKKPKQSEEKVDEEVVLKKLIKLEKKVAAMSKTYHTETIEEYVQANVINEAKNQFPKFLPKAVSEYVRPRMERMVHDKSCSFLAHEKLLKLFYALMNSMGVDERATKDVLDLTSKKRHHED